VAVIKTGIRPPMVWSPSPEYFEERERIALSILKKYGNVRERGWQILVHPSGVYVGPADEIAALARQLGEPKEIWLDPWLSLPSVLAPNVPYNDLAKAKEILDKVCNAGVQNACYAGRLFGNIFDFYQPHLRGFQSNLWQVWSDEVKNRVLWYIEYAIRQVTDEEVKRQLQWVYDTIKNLSFKTAIAVYKDGQFIHVDPEELLRTHVVEEIGPEEYIEVETIRKAIERRAQPPQPPVQQPPQARLEEARKPLPQPVQVPEQVPRERLEEARKPQPQAKTEVEVQVVPATVRRTIELVISMRPMQAEPRARREKERKEKIVITG